MFYMKIRNKFYYVSYVLLFVLLISLLIIGSFYDLEINMEITNFNSVFGMFFANFGEMPSWILLSLSGVIFFKTSKLTSKRSNKILYIIFSCLLILISCFFIFNQMRSKRNGLSIHIAYKVLIAIILETLIVLFGYKFINIDDKNILIRTALIILISYVIGLIILLTMKAVWYRPRYRLIYDGYSGIAYPKTLFREWYEPGKGLAYSLKDKVMDGGRDQFTSFPSGHSYGSMVGLLFFYIPSLNKKLENNQMVKDIVLVVAILFSLVVGFSRIIYGAHYLSDVAFGCLIATFITFIVPIIYSKVENYVKARKA